MVTLIGHRHDAGVPYQTAHSPTLQELRQAPYVVAVRMCERDCRDRRLVRFKQRERWIEVLTARLPAQRIYDYPLAGRYAQDDRLPKAGAEGEHVQEIRLQRQLAGSHETACLRGRPVEEERTCRSIARPGRLCEPHSRRGRTLMIVSACLLSFVGAA